MIHFWLEPGFSDLNVSWTKRQKWASDIDFLTGQLVLN